LFLPLVCCFAVLGVDNETILDRTLIGPLRLQPANDRADCKGDNRLPKNCNAVVGECGLGSEATPIRALKNFEFLLVNGVVQI
jgi:hypothetical protein